MTRDRMMVANNLLAFVGIGIVSGLALGLYLADAKDGDLVTSTVTIVDGPSISVVPIKGTFDLGEQVAFRITNTGTIPLHSEDGTYGAAITGLSGRPIYSFVAQDVAPHENTTGQDAIETHLDMLVPMDDEAHPFAATSGLGATHGEYWDLLPGDAVLILWDQIRHDGEAIQSGLYKVNVSAYAADATADAAVYEAGSDAYGDAVGSDTSRIMTTVKDSATIAVQ